MSECAIKNIATRYKVFGEGKPFLILHGWGSKADSWDKTAEIISKEGFKVIVPDLPGFGETEKPESIWNLDDYCDFVKDFINFLKLEDFCLLGHSFGGSVAIKLSLKMNVSKLFLVASSSIRKKNIKNNIFLAFSKIFKVFSFIPLYPLARKAFYKYIVKKSDYVYTEGSMKGTFLNIIREDLFPVLSSIKTPTVIIWGDKDNTTLLENAYLMHKEISNSKLVIIPGGTHDLERKMPRFLAEKIIDNL